MRGSLDTISLCKRRYCLKSKRIMKQFYIKWLMVVVLGACLDGLTAIETRSLLQNINNGIKYAGHLFGINTADDVADLVTRAFSITQHPNEKPLSSSLELKGRAPLSTSAPPIYNEQKQQSLEQVPTLSFSNLIRYVLQLIGFDVNKLGTLAINALMLITHSIGSTLMVNKPLRYDLDETYGPLEKGGNVSVRNERPKRELPNGTPIDWFLEKQTTHMRNLIDTALNTSITNHIVTIVSNTEASDSEGECVKMLLCRSAPFLWGMQKAVQHTFEKRKKGTTTNHGSTTKQVPKTFEKEIFRHMPTLQEYQKHAESCSKNHGKKCLYIVKK